MKKCWMILCLALLLTGCNAEPTFETLGNVSAEPASSPAQQILLDLPENTQVPALQSDDSGKIYFCDGITVCVDTLAAGDLDRTLKETTGYGKESLQLFQSYVPEGKCYSCAWTSTGEGQMQVCRARIIDDGSFHYVMTVTVPETQAGQLQDQVQTIMDSFRVVDADAVLNTGS